jgi:hypothetical protein
MIKKHKTKKLHIDFTKKTYNLPYQDSIINDSQHGYLRIDPYA